MLSQLDTVHFGHHDIGQQQIEPLFTDQRQRRRSAINGNHLIARALQRPAKIVPHGIIIFGQQDADHHRTY